MTDKELQQFGEIAKEEFEKQRIIGLSQGSKAMCGVINKMFKEGQNKRENLAVTVGRVVKFCNKTLGLPEQ